MVNQLLSVFFLFGAFQAILLLVSLRRRKFRNTARGQTLALLLVAIGMLLLHHAAITIWGPRQLPWLMSLAASWWFAIPPLLFLFVRALTRPDFALQPTHLWLFSVSIYNCLQWVAHLLGNRVGLYLLFSDADTYVYAWVGNYLLHGLVFGGWAWWELHRVQLSPKQGKRVRWLKWYFVAFGMALLASVALLAFFITIREYTDTYEYGLLALFEAFVLVLVYKSISFSPYFNQLSNETYGQAGRKNQELQPIAEALRVHMETERPYLDRQLTLHQLAQGSGIPENTLSQLFSQYLHTHFYEYVNQYRLTAFEKMLQQPAHRQYKITALAEACGFGSRAAFYKAFRDRHQMTPTQFLKQLK